MLSLIRNVIGGFLMGAADLVPGVSGGTIALVIGIYERLVGSIREGSSALGSLLRGRFDEFRRHMADVEWLFLISLGAGILTAIASLASLLEHQLEENPIVMAAGFFGLVVGSVLIAWRLLKQPASRHLVIAAVVGVGLFVLLGLGEEASVADPSLLAFFGAGALAICAMILPGISGSLILLLIGMYQAVLAAVNDRDFGSLGVFMVGAIIGLALFSQVLHWALRKHHDDVLAGLVGLMAGSLRVLWPWPEGVESAALGSPTDDLFPALVAGVIGFGFVFLVSRLAETRESLSEQLPDA